MISTAISQLGSSDAAETWPPELLGESAAMRRVRDHVRQAAVSRGRALLVIDAGFDGDRIARCVHGLGSPAAPFAALDCADTTPAALEQLLFGAQSHFAAARGGTLYLARITDMAASAQARLARALRDGEAVLDGGARVVLDLRVVASAAPSVDDEVEDGRLRSDLHRRLAASRIHVPSLRDRPEDIAPIALYLTALACRTRNVPVRTFTHAALASLAALPWPGNIAEMAGRIERLSDSAGPGPIRAEDVLADIRSDRRAGVPANPGTLRDARRHFEREYIAAVLSRHGWRIAEAAATLGIERANLYRKIRQVGLSRPSRGARGDR